VRHFRFIVILIYLFVIAAGSVSLAHSNQVCGAMSNASQKNAADEVLMQANRLTYDDRKKIYFADGAVEIYYQNYHLKADHIDYSYITQTANAKGNVRLYDFKQDITVKADNITLNQDFEFD